MSPVLSTKVALTAAATLLGTGAYLNAKLGIGSDLRKLKDDRAFKTRLKARIRQLGDEATLYRMLELADQNAAALWFEGRSITYGKMKMRVDALAEFLLVQGVKIGSCVGVYMTNSPEMVFTIYAIAKLGAVAALLNTALTSDTLSHCISIADTKLVIATPDLVANLPSRLGTEFLKRISLNLGYISALPEENGPRISTMVTAIGSNELLELPQSGLFRRPKRLLQDIGALIYTSGTTGKPKAVSIKNFQLVIVSTPLPIDTSNPTRYFPLRVYSCLPLFHATCLFTGLVYTCGVSGTFCIGRKFSASRFSQELTESRATRMLYVGELCRYLLSAVPSKYDQAHHCIVAMGNGLQKDIWERFQARFNIPEIREVYRSTEGLAKFDNFYRGAASSGKVGFSGVLGEYLEDDTFLVKYDHDRADLYRDPISGHCVLSAVGESGEAIGRVRSADFLSDYYNNPTATDLKFARDVFQEGDLFQRSGDMLVRDKEGWVRFHERTGDTFRWKGENVSTAEVKEYMAELSNVHAALAYGVNLNGHDGQVGAAAITLINSGVEAESAYLEKLYTHLRNRGLPDYAVPRLLRFTNAIDTGVTFKHAKEGLKKRSWNPAQNEHGDHLYWLNGKTYRGLDWLALQAIKNGKAKL